MRSKTILSTAAFIVAFASSAAFASLFITKTAPQSFSVVSYNSTSCFKYRNNSANANKIAALIRQDKNNGLGHGSESYRIGEDVRPPFSNSGFSDYAEAVEQYVDESSSMKTSDLPNDFQTGWREHMQAWGEYSEFLDRMKTASNRKGLSEEELEEIDNFHNREIRRTWQTVLQTGRSYGANVY